MLPSLATAACLLFIFYLFRTDLNRPDSPTSGALWIPLAWMFLAGSRWLSSWLDMAPTLATANNYSEGSPLDAATFSALTLAGILVLARRNIDWGRLLATNWLIVLYLLFCLVSISWTDDPFTLMKRWLKDLGNPIMALVILTERRPYEAIGAILRRLAFLLLPLSVLFIRYYPALGRSYHADGSPMYTGVGHQKNDLGLMCLIAGMYLFWELLQRHRKIYATFIPNNKIITIALTGMLAWLLNMSDSQTSLLCLFIVVLLLLLGRTPFIARRPASILGMAFCATLAIWLLEETLHLRDLALSFLGRDATLTNRTEVWDILSNFNVNPIVGAGFMSFWTGDRLETAWRLVGAQINQAHNGYLEQYLNLGYIGVAFIAAIIVSGLFKVRRHLSVDPAAGMLRLCFIVAAIVYNYTEASFYGINNMWILLLLGCIEVPPHWQQRAIDARRGLLGSTCKNEPPSRLPLCNPDTTERSSNTLHLRRARMCVWQAGPGMDNQA
jgi:exopolysaccharide production protein ExoQ